MLLQSSPPPFCPDGRSTDLETILSLIHAADRYIHIAVMDYYPSIIYQYPKRYVSRYTAMPLPHNIPYVSRYTAMPLPDLGTRLCRYLMMCCMLQVLSRMGAHPDRPAIVRSRGSAALLRFRGAATVIIAISR